MFVYIHYSYLSKHIICIYVLLSYFWRNKRIYLSLRRDKTSYLQQIQPHDPARWIDSDQVQLKGTSMEAIQSM